MDLFLARIEWGHNDTCSRIVCKQFLLKMWDLHPDSLGCVILFSNSEYVRSLVLAGPQTLYIATNQGHIHHVTLNDKDNLKWTEITKGEVAGPIVCLNLLVDEKEADLTRTASDGNHLQKDDLVAFGNGLGAASALGVQTTGSLPIVIWQCTWLADQERQLLGIFWCKSLGRR